MISFDSNNLESAYLIVNRLNKSDAPTREIQSENLSYQDGFNVVSNFWRSRTIMIGGTIDASSAAHLADTLDTLKQNLSGVNKNLDVDYGNSTRRYKGTLTRLEAPEEFFNITHLPYTAEFLCQPFGYATLNQTLTSNDVTGATYSNTLSVVGTYKPQPIITITMNSATSVTGGFSFANTTTGDTISISGSITGSDVFVINTETHKVTKNGVQVDFTGPMPDFATGDNAFTITMAGTARQYDLVISYPPRYL